MVMVGVVAHGRVATAALSGVPSWLDPETVGSRTTRGPRAPPRSAAASTR
ncbi:MULTISPECIES: hypothetical protein [Prauserella]|nr:MULTISPECIES: hypothetical protein [Prauserella]